MGGLPTGPGVRAARGGYGRRQRRAPSPPTTARVRGRRINATARPRIRYNPLHGVPVDASYETLDLLFSAVDERARLRAVGDEDGARAQESLVDKHVHALGAACAAQPARRDAVPPALYEHQPSIRLVLSPVI